MPGKSSVVSVLITGNAKGLAEAGKQSERAIDGIGDAAGRVGGALVSLGKIAAVGVGAAAVAGIAFAKGAISAASDLAENMSKSAAVFGTNADAIDKWATTAAKGVGLSKNAALEAASGFGNLFKQLGIGDRESAKMSTSIVGLAADFASFHNADITEVTTAQAAAFRGEYDSLQKFLPLINAASVEQKALEMTGKATTKTLTAQDKALAVNALMISGAGDAAGDFAKTADGLANKQRILKATFANVRAEIGTRLLPIMVGLSTFVLDKLLPPFRVVALEIAGGVRAFVAAFKAGDGEITSSGLPGFLERVGGVARQVFEWVKVNVPPILHAVAAFIRDEVIPVLGRLAGWIQEKLVPAIATMVASFQENIWPVLRDKVIPILQEVARILVEHVAPAVGVLIEFIVAKLIPAFFLVVEWIATKLIPKIAEVVESIINFGRNVWEFVDGPIKAIVGAIQGVISIVTTIVTTVFTAGKEIGEKLWAIVSKFAEWNIAVIGFVADVVKWFRELPGKILGFFDGLADTISAPFKTAFNLIADLWNSTVGKLSFEVPDWVPGLGGKGWDVPDIPKFGMGGVVPGTGPVLAVVHGGETILPTHRRGTAGAGGNVTYVTVVAPVGSSPAAVGRELRRYLNAYASSGGRP